jgi:ATP-binding cassette subfamily C (CFTR/MRP) protein 4
LGFRRNLKFTDLYSHPSEADSKYLLEKFNKYWSTELLRTTTGNSPRLLLVWFKCFWYRFLLQGLLHFIQVTITIAQALFLGRLSDYFITDEPSPVETRDAYLYAMAITLLAIFNSITVNIVYFMGYKLGALTRILMTSVIYQKSNCNWTNYCWSDC